MKTKLYMGNVDKSHVCDVHNCLGNTHDVKEVIPPLVTRYNYVVSALFGTDISGTGILIITTQYHEKKLALL